VRQRKVAVQRDVTHSAPGRHACAPVSAACVRPCMLPLHLVPCLAVGCRHACGQAPVRAAAAGHLDLIYTRVVTRREGFEFMNHSERAEHLALPMCGFERVAALILEPVSKGARIAHGGCASLQVAVLLCRSTVSAWQSPCGLPSFWQCIETPCKFCQIAVTPSLSRGRDMAAARWRGNCIRTDICRGAQGPVQRDCGALMRPAPHMRHVWRHALDCQ
jgi:hypothetical protein